MSASWPAVAAIASAVSASLSLIAITITGWMATKQGKVLEYNNSIDVVKQIGDAERRVKQADTKENQEFEFRALLNILETLAMLHNKKGLTKLARGYTEKYLVETLAWIEVDDEMRRLTDKR
jgi:hypothetical protein